MIKTGKRKYEHRHMITRTLTTTRGDVKFYNQETEENEIANFVLNGRYSAEEFLKRVSIPHAIKLDVSNLETNETLYAISVEDFIKHATIIE